MSISRPRWLVKKAARRAVLLSSWAARGVGAGRVAAREPAVRALIYHRFGDARRDPYCVPLPVFEAQVRWLAREKLAVSLGDLLAFVRGERTLPDGAVLITMDDGVSSVWTHAAPVLRAHGVPAVAFITTALVDERGADERYLTWEEVARLPEAGITVGSHAHVHRSLGRIGLDEAREEGARSRELLTRRLGRDIDSFAYPYGMRPDHNADTARLLGDLGYRSVFIAQHGVIRRGADPLCLPRVKVEGGEGAWLFQVLCRGGMDAWRRVDDNLWRLQRPE